MRAAADLIKSELKKELQDEKDFQENEFQDNEFQLVLTYDETTVTLMKEFYIYDGREYCSGLYRDSHGFKLFS